jgi:hypothetical protein
MSIPSRPIDPTHELVERIVRRLLTGGASALDEPLPIPPGAKPETNVNSPQSPSSSRKPNDSSAGSELVIPLSLITGEALPKDLSTLRKLRVPAGAVLTPTARERLLTAGIAIETINQKSTTAQSTSSAATTPSTSKTERSADQIKMLGIASEIGTAETGPGPALVAQLGRRGLQASLLKVDDLLQQVAQGSKGLILTEHPQRVVCEACRRSEIRAAHVTQLLEVPDVQADLQPNLWVLDMRRLSLAAAVPIAAACLRSGN